MNKENSTPQSLESMGPKIAVVGVGGAGSNAVDNMLRLGLKGVNCIVCNTDAQALSQSLCSEDKRVRLGFGVTRGLGAGSSPDVGRSAAEESVEDVMQHLDGVHMLFVTAGMGGGTGTGGAPVIAKAARERGILTIGVVTKPFQFEGAHRMKAAERGIEAIRSCVDTLLVIPNQNLFRLATDVTTLAQAFAMADDVLYSGVRTFTDLMTKPGLVNLDYADICTVMKNIMGKAMMGTGESSGPDRATSAAEKAIGCLLLDDVTIHGARAVLINITGGPDLTLYEVDEAIGRIKQEIDSEKSGESAHIIFGATYDGDMTSLRVSVVATGIDESPAVAAAPEPVLAESIPVNYATVGSKHDGFSFDADSFSSFSLREEAEEFGAAEPQPNVLPGNFTRKRSFLERLTGRRSPAPKVPASPVSEKVSEEVAPQSDLFSAEPSFADDTIHVPAFLRQNRAGTGYKK